MGDESPKPPELKNMEAGAGKFTVAFCCILSHLRKRAGVPAYVAIALGHALSQ